jgi:hypothetical protein
MEGHEDEGPVALLVVVERHDVRLVDFALDVAKKVAPSGFLI